MPNEDRAVGVPSHRRHKPTGQAVVTLSGKDYYLGRWNTKASRAEYDRLIGEWLVGGRCLPTEDGGQAWPSWGLPIGGSPNPTTARMADSPGRSTVSG